MPHAYELSNADELVTPSLVFYPEMIRRNIRAAIELAGTSNRLRPHVKTHKTTEIVQMQLLAGVRKHKASTIAECEMLAAAGAPDVLLSYPLLGPNLDRFGKLVSKYPDTHFAALVDHPATVANIAAMGSASPISIFIDLNLGMNRTGIPLEAAEGLYRQLATTPGIRAMGFHAYDGHVTQEKPEERLASIRSNLEKTLSLRERLEKQGFAVPTLVCGGTPGFPQDAAMKEIPGLECSPGTYVLHDRGYGSKYADLPGIAPAAVLLTRVVSRPSPNRVTFDLGNKAVAADPLMAKRIHLLNFPEHTPVMHSEEHYVVETAEADRYSPGDLVYALPGHICPSVALHREALIAENGRVVGSWKIAARDRKLTI